MSVLLAALAVPACSQQLPAAESSSREAPATSASANQQHDEMRAARVSGRVIDQSGANVSGVKVTLTRDDLSPSQSVQTDEDGLYLFTNVPPGPFHLTFAFEGLAPQIVSGTIQSSETVRVPVVTMAVAAQSTQVHVGVPTIEIAEQQVHEAEKQRVFGIIPNFWVSYVQNAAPLTPRLKFHLAWKSATDPITFLAIGALAGSEQANNQWKEYGQGIAGYGKRYGATYANVFTATFIGSAILPSILHQDPRYYYKGTGSKKSRILYALSAPFFCKNDDGRWAPNYSNIGGTFAAGGIANLYYPRDRRGIGLVFSTALVRFAEVGVANIFQEFVVPRFTPNLPTRAPSQNPQDQH